MEYWIVMCTRLRGEFSAIGLIIQTVCITKQRLFFAVAGKSTSAFNVPKQLRRNVAQPKGYVFFSLCQGGLKKC